MKTLASRLTWARLKKGLTQEELAKKAGVSQGSIGHLESGARKSSRKITAIAEALGVNALWLVEGKGSVFSGITEQELLDVIARPDASSITVAYPEDAPDPNVVNIPVSDVKFSAGNGHIAHYDIIEDAGAASYQLAWFQKEGMHPERTKRFRVKGDSMEPFLYNNDTILVNFDETNIVDGKLYAIRYGDELRVKYVHKLLNGSIILRSVNAFYKDEEITPELVNEHITIIGRVRDKSGRGGL